MCYQISLVYLKTVRYEVQKNVMPMLLNYKYMIKYIDWYRFIYKNLLVLSFHSSLFLIYILQEYNL